MSAVMHMKPPPTPLPQGIDATAERVNSNGNAAAQQMAAERAERHASGAAARPAPRARSAFVPSLLGLLALAGTLGFQTWQLVSDRAALQAAHAGQQQTVDSAGKLRTSLDALAADTQRLADTGNANAALLVAELKKRGITINAAATATK